MSMRVCKAEIYKFKNETGKIIPDYIIMNTFDGSFLDWINVEPTGIKEIDENIGCDGSVVVHLRNHADKIIDKLEECWKVI